MNSPEVKLFESCISSDIHLQQLWGSFSPSLNSSVESLEKARSIYSNALKITHHAAKEEKIKAAWLALLRQGSFVLCLKASNPRKYNFSALIELAESGETEFKIEFVKVDPKKCDLLAVAKLIRSISLESVGVAVDEDFYRQILASKDTFCLIAKNKQSSIACFYGTHLSLDGVELFHLNLLGRKLEYPSLSMIENLRNQYAVLKEHYPTLHYLTLRVAAGNARMISLYEKEGFQKCAYDETGTFDFPVYFYAKKIDPTFNMPLPSYEKFQVAMKIKREQQKKEAAS